MRHPFEEEVKKTRKANYSINGLILNRWSPRSMTAEDIAEEELFPLFEAARWAPSSYNNQPWRFLYVKRNHSDWSLFFNLMLPFNQVWAKNASVLLLVISDKYFEHNRKPCRTHSFDTGAAWMCMALEGAWRGLVVHAMEGFDYEQAQTALNIPDNYQIEALVAIGKRASPTLLSQELQQREKPSKRKSVSEIAREGKFQ